MGGQHNESELLTNCYKNSLSLAETKNIQSIAVLVHLNHPNRNDTITPIGPNITPANAPATGLPIIKARNVEIIHTVITIQIFILLIMIPKLVYTVSHHHNR
jgi:hypothetical protein